MGPLLTLGWILLTLFLFEKLVTSKSEVQTIGHNILPGQSTSTASPTIWIDLKTRIPPSSAIRWRLYSSIGHRPVRLQIWRPLGDNERFLLVAEHRVVPTSIGVHEFDLPIDERVKVSENDRLGFTNEMGEGPVAYEDIHWRNQATDTGGADAGYMWTEVNMMPQVNNVYKLSHLEPERRYSINLDVVTCQPEWSIVDIHCVQFIQPAANWTQASSYCQDIGGHLVTPRSWNFASSLGRAMALQGMAQTWLGLSYNDSTSYFTWTDETGGEIYSTHPWGPDDPRAKHFCIALTQLGHWASVNCSHRSPFICQNDNGRPMTSDGRGLMNGTSGRIGGGLINNDYYKADIVHSEDCTNITTWSRGQACLDIKDKVKLRKAMKTDRSVSRDVGLLESVSRKGRREGVTVLDLILINGILDAMLEDNSFSKKEQEIDEFQTKTFIQSLADITDTILSDDCNCTSAWKQMRQLHEGPLDTVKRMEGLVQEVVEHVTMKDNSTVYSVKKKGLELFIQTVEKSRIKYTYRHHIEDEDIEIAIPKTFFRNTTDNIGVSTLVFNHAHHLLAPNDKEMPGNLTLNSKVLSISIHPPHDVSEDSWMAMRIPHSKRLNISYQKPVCAYWDYSRSHGWSTTGCRVTHFHENATVCECNHLTNFAILMQSFDFDMTTADKQALSMVTYVGCALSVLGLLATLLTHLVCRCFSERGRILVNLCLALLASYILFIFGIDRHNHKDICKLIAVGLHYFYLSAFFWMLAQGIELYSKLRIVFMQRSKILHYCILGWGLPGVVVAVAVAMRYDDYGKDEYCWLSMRTGLVWSFIGPVVIIVLINFCVLCFVLSTFQQPPPGKEQAVLRHPHAKSRRTAARAAIILLPVLGLTWILGLLSVNEHTIIFQYLFAICNSSQGFLIFILHCLLNEEVRASWRRHVSRNRFDSFRSDVKSVSSSTSGGTRTGHQGHHTPTEVFPKSILKPSDSSCSNLPPHSRMACAQFSVLSDISADSGSVMSDSWEVKKCRMRMLSLAFLLPGRSKRVVITDPKKRHKLSKSHGPM